MTDESAKVPDHRPETSAHRLAPARAGSSATGAGLAASVQGIAKTCGENPPPSLDDLRDRHVSALRLSCRQRNVRAFDAHVDPDTHGRERDPCCPRLSPP